MLNKKIFITLAAIAALLISCEKEEDNSEPEVDVNTTSIIPSSNFGRPNVYLGCVEIGSRITTIKVWDHGTIDSDVVSIIANGDVIIDQKTLSGPDNPISVNYDFGYNGYNYITLYAHNEGDIPPNTCTISINGREFVLEANLQTNGSVDVIVSGYGVDCSTSNGGNGGTSGGTGGNTGGSGKGDVKFWVNRDFGCGPITVNVEGVGSSTITAYHTTTPDCSETGSGGNFDDLPVGTYNYTASCQGYTWSNTITISENSCLRYELRI